MKSCQYLTTVAGALVMARQDVALFLATWQAVLSIKLVLVFGTGLGRQGWHS